MNTTLRQSEIAEELGKLCNCSGEFNQKEFLTKLELIVDIVVEEFTNETEEEMISYFLDGKKNFKSSPLYQFFLDFFKISKTPLIEKEKNDLEEKKSNESFINDIFSFDTVSMIFHQSNNQMLKFLLSFSLAYFYSKYNRYNNPSNDVFVTQDLLDEFLRLEIPHHLFLYLHNPPFYHEKFEIKSENETKNEKDCRIVNKSTVEYINNNFICLTSFFLSDCFSDDRITNSVLKRFRRQKVNVKRRRTTQLDCILNGIAKRLIGGSNLMMKVLSRNLKEENIGKRSMIEYKQLSSAYLLEKLSMYEHPNSFLLKNRFFKNHLFQKLKQQQEQHFTSPSSNKYYFTLLLSITNKLLNVDKNTKDWIRYFSNHVLIVFDLLWKFSIGNKEDYRSLTDILVLLEKICRNDPMSAGKLLRRRSREIPIIYSLVALLDPTSSETEKDRETSESGDLKNVVFYGKRILQVLERVMKKFRVPNESLSSEGKLISLARNYSVERGWKFNFDGAGPNRPSQIFKAVKVFPCEFCGVEREDIKVCSRCKNSFYCSRECQLQNWKFHKLKCKKKSDGFTFSTKF